MASKRTLAAALLGVALTAACGAPTVTYTPLTTGAQAVAPPVTAEGFFDPDPAWAQSQLAKEFKAFNVKYRPKVVLDRRSFVDAQGVIHLSRLKFSSAFRQVAQSVMYDTTFIHLIRHETALALSAPEFHQGLDAQFHDAFGKPAKAFDDRSIDKVLARLRFNDRPEFVSRYAQLHPYADFAETFAVFMQKQGDPAKLAAYATKAGKNAGLARKFDYVRAFLGQLSQRLPYQTPTAPGPVTG